MMNLKKILIGSVALAGSAIGGAILLYKYRKTSPDGVSVIKPFELNRYLGTWYEIARFDFFYENNMDFVTANYSQNEDGSVRVVNRGYSYKKQRFQESVGRAVFVGDENEGRLKVSFFGPFYSGYNIVAIDDEYKYALVLGRNRNYLWILSREKEIAQDILEEYLEIAEELGYDLSRLVWTTQD